MGVSADRPTSAPPSGATAAAPPAGAPLAHTIQRCSDVRKKKYLIYMDPNLNIHIDGRGSHHKPQRLDYSIAIAHYSGLSRRYSDVASMKT
jgi:hypothetical protein